MNEHTQGRLQIVGPSEARVDWGPTKHDAGDYAIVDEQHHILGEAYARVGTKTIAPAEANARLWSAAPDLLDACEVALFNLRHLRDEHPAEWAAVVDPALATAWDKLQQAILAAKGGAA